MMDMGIVITYVSIKVNTNKLIFVYLKKCLDTFFELPREWPYTPPRAGRGAGRSRI